MLCHWLSVIPNKIRNGCWYFLFEFAIKKNAFLPSIHIVCGRKMLRTYVVIFLVPLFCHDTLFEEQYTEHASSDKYRVAGVQREAERLPSKGVGCINGTIWNIQFRFCKHYNLSLEIFSFLRYEVVILCNGRGKSIQWIALLSKYYTKKEMLFYFGKCIKRT